MKVVADRHIPFLRGILEPYCEIEYIDPKEITRDRIRDAEALVVRTRTRCNKDLLEGTRIKFIATATIGYDHIDTEYCRTHGIHWTNAPGCNSGSVMQYVAAALVMLQKSFGFRYTAKTLGVIGYGHVGKKVARLAASLGMRVLVNDPPLEKEHGFTGLVSLDVLIKESDIVTVHTPLNMTGEYKTYHLFDRERFYSLRPGTIFINTSRGEVVETSALIEAIDSGKIGAAVIDVWEGEPHIDRELLGKVFLATPHIAGYSADGKANATLMSVNALNQFFSLGIPEVKLNLPLPEHETLVLNAEDHNDAEIIRKAILHTYPIERDHDLLVNKPDNFELYRQNYPVRREFFAYTIHLNNADRDLSQMLQNIGFRIQEQNK
jgi:erythronate-4-phosphate dehydrogenase